jgi:Mg2+-importing ATPase
MVNSCLSSGIRSPLDQAVIDRCTDGRITAWKKFDEIPFDFERRSLTVLAETSSQRILVVKGAPERILAFSSRFDRGDGTTEPLDDGRRAALAGEQEQQASPGHRLLGVAWKPMPADRHELHVGDEQDLIFAGYCILVDPAKKSAAQAIGRLAAAGVRVKVVSGDREAVVRHVVAELKIPASNLLSGEQIAELTDAALAARISDTDLFAHVSPDQKTRIIRALQSRGRTVGFLGDGVCPSHSSGRDRNFS